MGILFFVVLVVVAAVLRSEVSSHGILLEPPGRSSLWRFGYGTPANYNDNELFCGGFAVQWNLNNGKCGICGDPYNQKQPRDNEAGGKYGLGIISKTYSEGQVIDVRVQLTANHRGWFEFRVCPNNDVTKEATQECLDEHLLEFTDGSGTRYLIPDSFPWSGTVSLQLQLPQGLTCSQCVFQWIYNAASNWGFCDDGSYGEMGCGPQENFRSCSDITIQPKNEVAD